MKVGQPMLSMKKELAIKLETLKHKQKQILIGFDGFVDEIIHAVDKRMDSENFTRIETMLQFAKRIEKAAGYSTNIELFPIIEKIGGNGPIMAHALSKQHAKVTYIGALGEPHIHLVFQPMAKHLELISIAQAAHTDALEFVDGKLMLGKMSCLNDVTYEKMIQTLGEQKLLKMLHETDLFATVNWSMLPHMTDIWQSLYENILPKLSIKPIKPIFFVDLADPEKREHHEIKRALDLLKSFESHFHVVLGLNQKEAYDVAHLLSLATKDDTLKHVNQVLYTYLEIYAVVIHPVDQSCAIVDGTFAHDMGPLAKNPKLTTGAGDNFNAGFVYGLLLGLTPHESLLLGMSTSGFYVRETKSPTMVELIDFLNRWDEQQLD